jgi:predicted nucleotidyltransferase
MNSVADISVEAVVARLRELAPALKAQGVLKLAIFGSRARRDARADSDLDVLVDTTGRGQTPPFDMFRVLRLIEDATGLKVQISMRELLKPRVAKRIADDLIEVF